MFRLILRLKSIRRTTLLLNGSYARRCSNLNNNNLNVNTIDEDVKVKRINLTSELNELNEFKNEDESNEISDDLKANLLECKNINELINLIKPSITKLSDEDIRLIFKRICVLNSEFKFDYYLKDEFVEILQNSSVYRSLLERTAQRISQLDNKILRILLTVFFITKQSSKSEIVVNTFNEIMSRLPNLESNEVIDYLRGSDYYLSSPARTDQHYEFYQAFLKVSADKILNNEFDFNDDLLILNFFSVFLKPENDLDHKVIDHLIKQLLSPGYEFNFVKCVKLLKKIKQSHDNFKKNMVWRGDIRNEELKSNYEELASRYKVRKLFSIKLNDLVAKLNSTIYNIFQSNPSDLDFKFYIHKIHTSTDNLNYELNDFYDLKLLAPLVHHLTDKIEERKSYKYYCLTVIQNYARFQIYDEDLLKLVYSRYLTEDKFDLNKTNVDYANHLYLFLAKYQWPFVDYQNLAKIFYKASRYRLNPLRILNTLILNDAIEAGMIYDLIKRIENLSENDLKENDFNWQDRIDQLVKELKFAKAYLLINSNIKNDLKIRIKRTIDESIYKMNHLIQKPRLNLSYIKTNDKIQRNGFLSIGLEVGAFVIYDKIKGDLIPLNEIKGSLFYTIDKIKLTPSQELVVFVKCDRLKGNLSSNYELSANYHLKKILNYFNIKSIEVSLAGFY